VRKLRGGVLALFENAAHKNGEQNLSRQIPRGVPVPVNRGNYPENLGVTLDCGTSQPPSMSAGCPLYPQKRTLVERVGMSALCHKQTCRQGGERKRKAGSMSPGEFGHEASFNAESLASKPDPSSA